MKLSLLLFISQSSFSRWWFPNLFKYFDPKDLEDVWHPIFGRVFWNRTSFFSYGLAKNSHQVGCGSWNVDPICWNPIPTGRETACTMDAVQAMGRWAIFVENEVPIHFANLVSIRIQLMRGFPWENGCIWCHLVAPWVVGEFWLVSPKLNHPKVSEGDSDMSEDPIFL